MSMRSFLLLGLPDAFAAGSKITNFDGLRLTPEKSGKKFPNQPFVIRALTLNDEPKWFSAHFTLSRGPFSACKTNENLFATNSTAF